LDRFAHLEVLKTTFKNKKVAKPNKLYEDVFGISIPEETPAQIIRIKTSKEKAEYLKTIPWHISQKIVEETKTFAMFEFYLKPNYEFKQLILMQGSDVEVISPKALRAEIKEKVAELFKLYK
jgi:predicted DNA-binding transcriptional regulator YafY